MHKSAGNRRVSSGRVRPTRALSLTGEADAAIAAAMLLAAGLVWKAQGALAKADADDRAYRLKNKAGTGRFGRRRPVLPVIVIASRRMRAEG